MGTITAEQFEAEGHVAALQMGDPAAQRLYFCAFHHYLASIVRKTLRTHGLLSRILSDEIEDLIMESLEHVLIKIDKYALSKGTFRTWAGRVVSNFAIDWIRTNAAHAHTARGEAVMEQLERTTADGKALDLFDRAEGSLADALFSFRQANPEFARDIDILLSRLELLLENDKPTQSAIAERIGCSDSTITNHLKSWETGPFLKDLRHWLAEQGFADGVEREK